MLLSNILPAVTIRWIAPTRKSYKKNQKPTLKACVRTHRSQQLQLTPPVSHIMGARTHWGNENGVVYLPALHWVVHSLTYRIHWTGTMEDNSWTSSWPARHHWRATQGLPPRQHQQHQRWSHAYVIFLEHFMWLPGESIVLAGKKQVKFMNQQSVTL